jgi:hypothetical protein
MLVIANKNAKNSIGSKYSDLTNKAINYMLML